MNLEILYEDNHLIAVNKKPSQLSQRDKTSDNSLIEEIKAYLKEKYHKPGNLFCGLIHRLDRPCSGVLLFAKTSKALERMNQIFRNKETRKIYWAICYNKPPADAGTLENFLVKNEKLNKVFISDENNPKAKKAILHYKLIAKSEKYYLVEVELVTGRHHQIRAQLAAIGCPIRGDVKYGASRQNKDLSIDLHARSIEFTHPIKKETIKIIAPPPDNTLWNFFVNQLKINN